MLPWRTFHNKFLIRDTITICSYATNFAHSIKFWGPQHNYWTIWHLFIDYRGISIKRGKNVVFSNRRIRLRLILTFKSSASMILKDLEDWKNGYFFNFIKNRVHRNANSYMAYGICNQLLSLRHYDDTLTPHIFMYFIWYYFKRKDVSFHKKISFNQRMDILND